ncbi:MAG: hypothetical protein Kow0077_10610 [Anaerolineae bacterium]
MNTKTRPATDTYTASDNGGPAVKPAGELLGWKTRTYLIGAVLGLLLGLLSAYLFVRAAEESSGGQPKKIKTGDAMKMTLSILTLVRQIAEIGSK